MRKILISTVAVLGLSSSLFANSGVNAVYAINDNIEFEFIYSHTDNDDEKTTNFKSNLSYSF